MEDLFAAWNEVKTHSTSSIQEKLLRERHHPVLKQIRKQMIIELIGFVLFLVVYYDFFDGAKRPVYANILLVVAMLGVIAGNVVGYVFAKQGVQGENVKELLGRHLVKMRIYAAVAVLARALMMAGVVVFFKANVTVVVVFVLMGMALAWLWTGRIRKLKRVYLDF